MYEAYITELHGLRRHSNADRLQCVSVFGNNVIVDYSYTEGQRVIYFPVDGQLSEEFAADNNLVRIKDENGNNIGGYLDPEKRNITALKLRGEKSDGLVLPIEVLSKYTDVSQLKNGDRITVLNGHEICRKYIPRHNSIKTHTQSTKTNKKESKYAESYPLFIEHEDTAQLAYNQNAFKPGDICIITLKMHGTSARTANTIKKTIKKRSRLAKKLFHIKDRVAVSYDTISGTRRTTLRSYDGGFYGNNSFRKQYHDFFKEKLPKGIEVYYEIVGYTEGSNTIMAKCNNKLIRDKEFANWEDLMQRVEKYYDGADPVGKTHVREGVVVRIANRPKFTAYKHKNFSFKCLEGICKDMADSPDIEEAEELLNE